MTPLTLRERLAHDYLLTLLASAPISEGDSNTDHVAEAFVIADAFLAARPSASEVAEPCPRFDCAGIDEGCGDRLDPHASTRCGEWDHRCTCGLSYSQHAACEPAAEPVREAREEAYRHAFEPLPKGARVAGHEATAVERAEICRHCGDGPEHPDHEAREAEPVAWRYDKVGGTNSHGTLNSHYVEHARRWDPDQYIHGHWRETPLYAAPREAEGVRAWLVRDGDDDAQAVLFSTRPTCLRSGLWVNPDGKTAVSVESHNVLAPLLAFLGDARGPSAIVKVRIVKEEE